MNVGITGASGLLGGVLAKLFNSEGDTSIAIDRGNYSVGKKPSVIVEFLSSLNIDVLVHCAANTNVEECETSPEQCYSDNYLRTELLAFACKELNIKMVYISSTGVYGDYKSAPYCEFDPVRPTTHHHSSKLLAEQVCLRLVPDSVIVRTGWLFGGDVGLRKNFVVNRIKEAKASSGYIQSDITQYGCPTYVNDLSKQINLLVGGGYFGVFNSVSEGTVSRYDYVKAVIELAGLDVEVRPVDAGAFNRKAKVSHNEGAINYRLNQFDVNIMRDWDVALEEYLFSLEVMAI